jgi:hypothetical protein
MKITKQKNILVAFALVVAVSFASFISPAVSAACPEKPRDIERNQCCGEVEVSILGSDACKGDNAIWGLLLVVLNIMTAGVGIAAVGGIVYGAILYSSAGDKGDQTKKAIGIITNVVIGIISYALMYLFLNFLIPGGIFK